MSGYLQELTLRLSVGASRLSPEFRSRHADWLRLRQRDDGGFAGREGESDPYYSSFALRTLWLLDELDPPTAEAAGIFLRRRMRQRDSIVDLMSLIFGAAILEMASGVVVISDEDHQWRDNVAALLADLRTDDGGFAKTPEGRAGSTYQTFLSVLCYELMEVPVPDVDGLLRFLASQQQPDGGYREIRVAKRAGVNPTAAAIGSLKTLGRLDPAQQADTIEFLLEMQSDEGGLTANTRIPFADLLSSCTGLITLVDLGAGSRIDAPRLQRYADSMQREGGFVGFELDQTPDVEYTFYGVATLSLLQTLDL
ncbi:putative beta-subunit of geranylgeranyltransferase or farnesyltransferase [Rhodopirellula islandica]|uniref:Geranylgeranyl transferase type II subunit beta n=1 Tax=Rhodopirellula islandica TaxID=595434 RepID=A0A0J1B7V6_RHOIS|nr:prenyltransferase/squalene oxidase repeat-containing protein [Rhodopirellula islandica]KLU02658.1 putative beta-subunit of geranylgeranyltransferase or farnesyltransferase [Rhodopirellula islandica]